MNSQMSVLRGKKRKVIFGLVKNKYPQNVEGTLFNSCACVLLFTAAMICLSY
jgi:hypothetical protein